MTVTITWQTIITAGAVVTALGILIRQLNKTVIWFNRQGEQDDELAALRAQHEQDMATLREAQAVELASIKHEQTILTYGVLACLEGLKEQGCNGPVTEAINKIKKHLNQRAHDEGGTSK